MTSTGSQRQAAAIVQMQGPHGPRFGSPTLPNTQTQPTLARNIMTLSTVQRLSRLKPAVQRSDGQTNQVGTVERGEHVECAARSAVAAFSGHEPAQVEQQRIAVDTARRAYNEPKPNTFDLGEGHVCYETVRNPDGTTGYRKVAEGGAKLNATTQKAIDEADDFVKQSGNAIGSIREAIRLNNTAYSGYAAGPRATAMIECSISWWNKRIFGNDRFGQLDNQSSPFCAQDNIWRKPDRRGAQNSS